MITRTPSTISMQAFWMPANMGYHNQGGECFCSSPAFTMIAGDSWFISFLWGKLHHIWKVVWIWDMGYGDDMGTGGIWILGMSSPYPSISHIRQHGNGPPLLHLWVALQKKKQRFKFKWPTPSKRTPSILDIIDKKKRKSSSLPLSFQDVCWHQNPEAKSPKTIWGFK